jgi:hypothetical protein
VTQPPCMHATLQGWHTLIFSELPFGNRRASLLPMEGGKWQVTLAVVGGADGSVPRVTDGDEPWLGWASQLPNKTLYKTLKRCNTDTPGRLPDWEHASIAAH